MRFAVAALALVACSGKHEAHEQSSPPAPSRGPQDAGGAGDDRYDREALGSLTFALTEGTPAAKDHFQHGLLALHSFWYDEAQRQFDAAIRADPTMNMAYWGAAFSRIKILWGDDDVVAARDLLRKMPAPDHVSPREQTWIAASLELVGEGDVRTTRIRFADAMQQLDQEFHDDESTAFLALATLAAQPDSTDARKRAGALAESVFAHNPKHPGAAHYAIHAYDTPELAKLGLPYAMKYAQIAPSAFHARHMPAHIFSRLGMWADAITSCQAAWDASLVAKERDHLSADHEDFHSLNWLIEMSFELGHTAAARAALATFQQAVTKGLSHATRALYAAQVESFMIRTGEWANVETLLAPLSAPAAGDAPGNCGPAITQADLQEQLFATVARAHAAAARHDVAGTDTLLAKIDELEHAMRPALERMQTAEALAKLDAASAHRKAALRARARGDDRKLIEALRWSADQQPTGESNPNGFLAEEEIGDAYLRLADWKHANDSYVAALAKQPKRARSLLGAARAAAKLGQTDLAHARYKELADMWASADENVDGLAEARADSK